jgi:crotonobetainyl-CoA:carnitine CoA-transferase CaiB-like acyl-CoA transferase
MLPLQGVRVVDLSAVVFGPLASQVLADFGADVIKVEPPEGDSTRHTGPATEPGMSALFLGANHSKRSVVLDLKQPAAHAALMQLLESADVFMHSMRPQKLAPLGLAPSQLMPRFPRLIYTGLHGFGDGGPYSGRPAYDDIIQGQSGLADLMRRQGGEPRYLPSIGADKQCGQAAAQAILAALFARERSGQGCVVEVPMFETMVGFNLVEHLYGRHFEPAQPPGAGYPRVLAPWRRPYRTLDGHLCMLPYTDAHWRQFFTEAGAPGLADDPRFAHISERTRHVAALLEIAAGLIAQRSTADWMAICQRVDIPAAPVAHLDELPDDPHLRAVGYFTELDDPAMGRMRYPGVATRFNGQRPSVRHAPRLGQHTREVLRQAGLDDAQIDALNNAT